MRRPPRELGRKLMQVNVVPVFECYFADPVLLDMVGPAQADRPAVGRLQSDSAVGLTPDMSALYRTLGAAGDRAVMLAHPGAMGGALPRRRLW